MFFKLLRVSKGDSLYINFSFKMKNIILSVCITISNTVVAKEKPVIWCPALLEQHKIGLVFDRFYRKDKSRSSKEHFSLGLTIAADLAALQKLNLSVTDTDDGGCTFTLKFWKPDIRFLLLCIRFLRTPSAPAAYSTLFLPQWTAASVSSIHGV